MLRRFAPTASLVPLLSYARAFSRSAFRSQEKAPTPDNNNDAPDYEPAEDMGPMPRPDNKPKFFNLIEDDKTGFTTLQLNRAPVNSINLEFFEELNQWLQYLGDSEEKVHNALIISSGVPHVYSAGLDIAELYKPDQQRFLNFWSNFQEFFVKLHFFPKPTIASINGNSPAGGCIIALGCDYRIMLEAVPGAEAKPYRIGLNETKLGLVPPPWVMSSMAHVVGRRRAERMVQLGETPTAKEALAIGLVDETATTQEELDTKVVTAAKKFAAIQNYPRYLTRDMMRSEITYAISDPESREQDLSFFSNMIQSPDVQKSLGDYLERLRGKK